MEFHDKIIQELKGLNKKQLGQFAWLCGVRALPFLSEYRYFTYWLEEKQKYLYNIINALDVGSATSANSAKVVKIARIVSSISAGTANTAAIAAYAIAASMSDKDSKATIYAAANAGFSAAYAAATAEYTTDAVIAEYTTYAAYTAYAATTYSSDWGNLLLNDLESIKNNKFDECNHDIGIYGKLWDSFQDDLKIIDCAYWAQYYTNLFNNGFTIDKKQLERHFGVPYEIKEEGAAAVGHYLESLGDKVERLNEVRIIILGEKGAGKTSLAKRLRNVNAPMPKNHESTEGVETSLWCFKGKDGTDINAHIWDFAGHSITHAVHRCFMSARCLYIYVYNERIERDNDPTYWLEQIRIHGGDSPILFLLNEKDGHKVDIAEKTLKDKYPSIVGYYRVNIGSKDKTSLKDFCQIVMDMVGNNPSWNNQVVSKEAHRIKNELREHFDKKKAPYITRKQFDEIAQKCGASAKYIEDILNYLHTLGICLWYNKPDMKDFNMLVLNPDWVTNGIYRIINQSYNEQEYKLTISKGTEILKNDKRYNYPQDKVAYLFKLMRLYKLAIFKNKNNIFILGILPLDRPDGLPDFDDPNDRLTMSFVVEKALPPSITARIIVQRSEEILDEKLLWRKGAVFTYKDSDTIALISEEGRSITLRVKGTEKTTYIASLRETIKDVFEEYQVIKPDLLYEVFLPEKSEKNELQYQLEKEKPLMLSEEKIINYLQVMRPYFDTSSMREISLDITGKKFKLSIKTKETEEMKDSIKTKGGYSPVLINSPGAIVNSKVNQSLPDTVTEEQYKQILKILEKLLESEQAEKLTDSEFRTAQTELAKARKEGREKGWERILSIASNIATIGSAIFSFLH
jgi:GTPase SAR1 family protein